MASLALFTAIISVNLAVLNLLPVPMLDGGHLLFFVIEAVLGRPLVAAQARGGPAARLRAPDAAAWCTRSTMISSASTLSNSCDRTER